MWKVREIADKVTNVVMNYTDIEAKVREATNDDPWGPTGVLMQEVAQATMTYEHFPEVMTMLWKRMLQDNRKNWRRTYKALLVLNYLVRNGSERVVTSAREHIYDLRGMENYTFVDEFGKDQGINVRHKVKELIDFIQDDDKLREERKKAKKNKDKYVGMSSDAMGMHGLGGNTWDETPRWRKEEINEWDQDRRGDDSPNSDAEERYDSDPDSFPPPRNIRKSSPTKEYKDSESIDSSPPPTIGKLSSPAKTSVTTKTRTSTPTRRVDLGAAANYGKSQVQQTNAPKNDLLGLSTESATPADDLFNPRASDTSQSFGDFSSAFGNNDNTSNSKGDEFADFTSAFSSKPSEVTIPPVSAPVFTQSSNVPTFISNGKPPVIQPSNTDLLLGLSSPSVSMSPVNPLDDLAPLQAEGDHLVMATKKILQVLNEDKDCAVLLEQLISCLPGPLTTQKMDGTDSSAYDWDNYTERCYGKLLSQVLQHFKADWARNRLLNNLHKLFVVESGSEAMLYESLTALCDGMNDCKGPCLKLTFILNTLENVIKSDFITSAVISASKRACNNDAVSDVFITLHWENLVQLLVSLPSRISNKLKGKIDRCFTVEVHVKNILVHVAKCLVYLHLIRQSISVNVKPVAILLSRTIASHKLSNSFADFLKLLNSWCLERGDQFCALLNNILMNLEPSSVDTTAILILKTCSEKSVLKMMSPDCLSISSWNYTICKKIPFMTFHDEPQVITNLIAFLGNATRCSKLKDTDNSLSSKDLLPTVLLQLITVWSDKTAMLHTPQEQHLYLSKMLVVGINYLYNYMEIPLNDSLKNELQLKMFKGMPSHLENTTESVRIMGMITAECVVYTLNSMVENKEHKFNLQFDFSKVSKDNTAIVDTIKHMSGFKFNENNINFSNGDDLLCKMITEVERETNLVGNICAIDVGKTNKLIKDLVEEVEDANSELDSDDDFTPYDTSIDIKVAVSKRPKYLRDLIEGFKEENDIDVWIGSLEVCEELVYKQLPEDDVTLGIDLLDILLCLEKKTHCTNFDDLRFSSAVAIIVVYPEKGAHYLCKQFHEDFGKYSIAQRMLMLDILSASAKILSSPKSNEKKTCIKDIEVKQSTNDPDWYSVVKTRIESHTRKFCQSKKQPAFYSENKFSNVAGSFIFPLLRGKGRTTPGIVYRQGSDQVPHEECSLLLVHFLRSCAVIVACSVNAPAAARMGKELLEATWSLRFHQEARVREAVIACLAAVVMAVPVSRITSDMYDEMMEARMWLDDIINSQGIVGGRSCEVDQQCRSFAAQVALIIGNSLIN
ncbi:telomere length regulation protein TEL2 homolog isoform X1 [Macrosteles quadrilineatus]|uniref:telomere length regulation protein TEL2 homolog isoform X1 n=1 Tax=Macrosteles quadrilineatus TaxID=74068 RepID=UPI0023E295A5|nr:telomere length regulation protein TEL2 homolog isoform X1 [Macrosteles quadrilineatus]